MKSLLAFALQHDVQAWIDGDAVVLGIEVYDSGSRTWAVVPERARNFAELRALLGY